MARGACAPARLAVHLQLFHHRVGEELAEDGFILLPPSSEQKTGAELAKSDRRHSHPLRPVDELDNRVVTALDLHD